MAGWAIACYLKAEGLQKIGAFKIRGALNALIKLNRNRRLHLLKKSWLSALEIMPKVWH